MADGSKIEWTDATVNAVNGCSVVSPGCKHCYAMKLAGTRLRNHPSRAGLTIATDAGPVWNGEVKLHEPVLLQPLRWQRPRRIFWNAHGDLFHPKVPDEWIDRVFAVCALTPQHTHQILSKRSGRMQAYCSDPATPRRLAKVILDNALDWCGNYVAAFAALIDRPNDGDPEQSVWPLPNVHLGVSVEDQPRADERIPDLLATPAAVRFLSCEPLLGPVNLRFEAGFCRVCGEMTSGAIDGHCMDPASACFAGEAGVDALIHWVIVGGESGHGARPMHPDWARSLRDQCAAAGVPFHFKQHGEYLDFEHLGERWNTMTNAQRGRQQFADGKAMIHVGKKAAGRLLDGVEHNGVPA